MPKKIEMIGKKFNNLLVLKEMETRRDKSRIDYLCICDCGNTKIADGYYLRTSQTNNCGCATSAKKTKTKRKYSINLPIK